MNKHLVSIVTTAYNTGKYLEDYLKTIMSQTHTNWEIIFVDDNSTDNTVERMKELVIKNNIISKVKMFRNAHNYGYGASLYATIDNASGELIAIVDSDDGLSQNTALELMVKTHVNNPNVSLVYSNYEECRDDLKPYKKINCTSLKPGQSVMGSFKNGKYSGSDVIISHLKTFKKSFYDKTDGVNPYLKKAVDRDIVLKLEEVGDLIHIPEYLYLHRIHSGSISSVYRTKPREYKNEIVNMKNKMYQMAWERREKKKEEANRQK